MKVEQEVDEAGEELAQVLGLELVQGLDVQLKANGTIGEVGQVDLPFYVIL